MGRVASDASVGGSGQADRHELAVGGAATGTDPFGGDCRDGHELGPSSGGGELLEGTPDELRCFGRRAIRESGPHRIVGCGQAVSESHQGPDRLLGSLRTINP